MTTIRYLLWLGLVAVLFVNLALLACRRSLWYHRQTADLLVLLAKLERGDVGIEEGRRQRDAILARRFVWWDCR